MNSSLLYRPGALLSQPELSAARLDGLVFEVADAYMPADLPEDAAARVAALSPVLAPGFAASGPSAAWIHGTGDRAPIRHHIQRMSPQRRRIVSLRNVLVHESRLASEDVQMIAAAPVTTPLRTMVDLAIRAGRDAECASWLRDFAVSRHDLVRPALDHIAARQRMPGKRAAVTALDLLLVEACQERGQEVVTR